MLWIILISQESQCLFTRVHMLEVFDITPTEHNQFVFNQSAKFVTIICRTFHPAAFMEHHILSWCKDSAKKLQADEALTMVAKLHGCIPSNVHTHTYNRDYVSKAQSWINKGIALGKLTFVLDFYIA